MELKPTLWRTCRVLANANRLRILRSLIRESPRTVSAVSGIVHLRESVASDYLRLLQSRGLIQCERRGRYVFYSDRSDPAVSHAGILLSALRNVLSSKRMPLESVVFTLTAFTHPRRVLIVKLLSASALRTKELQRSACISEPALARHLAKLRRRSIVAWKRGFVKCAEQSNSILAACLIRLAKES